MRCTAPKGATGSYAPVAVVKIASRRRLSLRAWRKCAREIWHLGVPKIITVAVIVCTKEPHLIIVEMCLMSQLYAKCLLKNKRQEASLQPKHIFFSRNTIYSFVYMPCVYTVDFKGALSHRLCSIVRTASACGNVLCKSV